MEDLLQEYKKTLDFTKEEMRYIRAGNKSSILPDVERAARINKLVDVESYYSFLLFAESNLVAAIEALEPTIRVSNVKKHSVERMTFVVDPDDDLLKTRDKYSHDTLSVEEIAQREHKKRLAKEIFKSLTKQQQNILDLSSRGFTRSEISKMLGCTHQNVTATLKAIKKKITNEGWMMV